MEELKLKLDLEMNLKDLEGNEIKVPQTTTSKNPNPESKPMPIKSLLLELLLKYNDSYGIDRASILELLNKVYKGDKEIEITDSQDKIIVTLMNKSNFDNVVFKNYMASRSEI